MVDESRSAKVFGDMAAQIKARNPERPWLGDRAIRRIGLCLQR